MYGVTTWLTKNYNTHIAQSISQEVKNITWDTFFLKDHAQNMVEKLFPESILKNQNWVYLWINSLKFYTVCFYTIPSWGYQNKLELSCRPLAFTSCKVFYKNRKRPGTTLPASSFSWFLKKNICRAIFY